MTAGTVTYLYPNGPKAPTQAQMDKDFTAVHALVTMAEDSGPVDVVHNMMFESEAPAEVLQIPIVTVTAVSGGPNVQHAIVTQKDENTTTISKASGLGTQATYDVWISRHAQAKPWKPAPPKAAPPARQQ